MGCVDAKGRAVSYIQSIFHGFGSGVFLPQTGIVWQNRGAGFSLDPAAANVLAPRKKTRHTLNPALALFADGRSMVYGTMGGDGQPQTQAAIFSRIAHFGYGVQAAVSAPRWLLGQTWEGSPDDVKVENRIDPGVIAQLRAAGHKIVLRDAFDEVLGHAGAILRHRSGALEGAADPRSDGCVASV
jgi:gamma-glutamyltranspeptidase/glutathione hydrolase